MKSNLSGIFNRARKSEILNNRFVPGLKAYSQSRILILLTIIAAMVVCLSIINPRFLSYYNFSAITGNDSMKGLVLIGMTLILITGNFDVSVGSNIALVGIVTAWMMQAGLSPLAASMLGIASGMLIGLFNGLMVTRLKIHSFIATLGSLYMARSLAQVITQGTPIGKFPQSFIEFGDLYIFKIPFVLIILVVSVIAANYLLQHSRLLRSAVYIGTNKRGADYIGLRTDAIQLAIFVLVGLLVGIAGVFLTAKMRSGLPTAFTGLEFKMIAAAVLGGASLNGGQGNMLGSIMGLIVLILISNAMTILGISVYMDGVIMGIVLIGASVLDSVSQKNVI